MKNKKKTKDVNYGQVFQFIELELEGFVEKIKKKLIPKIGKLEDKNTKQIYQLTALLTVPHSVRIN